MRHLPLRMQFKMVLERRAAPQNMAAMSLESYLMTRRNAYNDIRLKPLWQHLLQVSRLQE